MFFVVDRLTKYVLVFVIQSTYTTCQMEEVPMKEIHRLDDIPNVIVSDKDPKFIGIFLK
jgi:hypothetical protein